MWNQTPQCLGVSATLSLAEELYHMAEKVPQTFANHSRFDPPFHYFAGPVFFFGLLFALVHIFAHITEGGVRDQFHGYLVSLLAAAFLVICFNECIFALKVEDRVNRLEERLRLAMLLPEPL